MSFTDKLKIQVFADLSLQNTITFVFDITISSIQLFWDLADVLTIQFGYATIQSGPAVLFQIFIKFFRAYR